MADSGEQRRLAHLAAEAAGRQAKVAGPAPAPDTRDHAAEVLAAHGCTPPSSGVTPSSGG